MKTRRIVGLRFANPTYGASPSPCPLPQGERERAEKG